MKLNVVILGVISVFVVVVGVALAFQPYSQWVVALIWVSGAGTLGLVSGYSSAVATKTAVTSELLKLLAGGILVPLVAGIQNLVSRTQQTIETNTYTGTQLTQKISGFDPPSPTHAIYDPLVVLGVFFAAYGICSIFGVVLGSLHKAKGISINTA